MWPAYTQPETATYADAPRTTHPGNHSSPTLLYSRYLFAVTLFITFERIIRRCYREHEIAAIELRVRGRHFLTTESNGVSGMVHGGVHLDIYVLRMPTNWGVVLLEAAFMPVEGANV